MGGSTKTTQSQIGSSTTTPWAAAIPGLSGIVNQAGGMLGNAALSPRESSAFDTLAANAAAGNPYAARIGGAADSLLGGGPDRSGYATDAFRDFSARLTPFASGPSDAYSDYQRRLTPFANGPSDAFRDYQRQLTPFANGANIGANSGLRPYLDTIANDVQTRINGIFAGAGRDLSGANQGQLARGIAEGTAPVIASQYNQDVANQLNAAGQLYGAGNQDMANQIAAAGNLYSAGNQDMANQIAAARDLYGAGNNTAGILSGLDQTRFGNQLQGIEASQSALQARDSGANQQLLIEAQRRGIPVQNLAQLESLLLPPAQAFGTTNSSSFGTQEQRQPLSNQIVGGVVGGLGLAGQLGGFGPTGWLFSTPKAAEGAVATTGILNPFFRRQ